MEGGTYMPMEESEMIMQLLGVHYFQDFNSDFSSWLQKDTSIGLNYELNNQEKGKLKRKCEIKDDDDKLNSYTNLLKKKARACNTTNVCKGNEEEMSSSSVSENESIDKPRASNAQGKNGNQSLYARKRREKINQRLRKLQELIPNGTKVDISTMLSEAFQYIKFLQLQIKLLSSEEMWMYAPLALDGINTGFDMNIPQAQD